MLMFMKGNSHFISPFFFSLLRMFLVDDDSGLSLLGQSAKGLNFYDDSGHSPLAD
jgi:hypothetical protein